MVLNINNKCGSTFPSRLALVKKIKAHLGILSMEMQTELLCVMKKEKL